MRIPPGWVIEHWPTPNYVNPVTHGPAILIVNVIFLALVLVAFVGRFYSRIVVKKWFGIDDVMCVLGLVSAAFHLHHAFAVLTLTVDIHNRHWNRGDACERQVRLESSYLGSACVALEHVHGN